MALTAYLDGPDSWMRCRNGLICVWGVSTDVVKMEGGRGRSYGRMCIALEHPCTLCILRSPSSSLIIPVRLSIEADLSSGREFVGVSVPAFTRETPLRFPVPYRGTIPSLSDIGKGRTPITRSHWH